MNSDLQLRQLSLTNMFETVTMADNHPQEVMPRMAATIYNNPQREIIDIRKQFRTTLPLKARKPVFRTDVRTTRITNNDCIVTPKPEQQVKQVLNMGQVGCCGCTLPCAIVGELWGGLKFVGLVVINAFRGNE